MREFEVWLAEFSLDHALPYNVASFECQDVVAKQARLLTVRLVCSG